MLLAGNTKTAGLTCRTVGGKCGTRNKFQIQYKKF